MIRPCESRSSRRHTRRRRRPAPEATGGQNVAYAFGLLAQAREIEVGQTVARAAERKSADLKRVEPHAHYELGRQRILGGR